MPRELVVVAPREPVLREYQEKPLQPNEVRIRSAFSAVKHGTELGYYRGNSADINAYYNSELKLFMSGKPGATYPLPLGNMVVGNILEIGSEVKKFKVNDRVFGWFPIRETHSVPEDCVRKAPEEMSAEAIVCLDPAIYGLGAVRDANIRLGEKFAIFGLGAIGLMALQMAKLSGATLAIAVDPLEKRRQLASKYGADFCLNPTEEDIALKIRKLTEKRGVDVTIEASGSYPALNEAIRSVAFGGRVVPLAAYKGESKGLRLGDEWHMNRITMYSTRAHSEPNRDCPLWDCSRIDSTAFRLLKEGKLNTDGLIYPIVPFEKSLEAYRAIDSNPAGSIKLGVTY